MRLKHGKPRDKMTVLSNIKDPSPMLTASGKEHGLVNVTRNSVENSNFKRFKEQDRPAMEALRKEESKLTKARYINTLGKSETLELTYCRWDGDPLLEYRFIPNFAYEVPNGLIMQVNGKKVMKRSGLIDSKENVLAIDQVEQSEHMFVPLGF